MTKPETTPKRASIVMTQPRGELPHGMGIETWEVISFDRDEKTDAYLMSKNIDKLTDKDKEIWRALAI